jgi:hypothetical protein
VKNGSAQDDSRLVMSSVPAAEVRAAKSGLPGDEHADL